MITQRTRLDMRPGGVLPVVHVSQYDNDAAALIFDLYNGGELFSVPSGSSVLLNGLKPDNYGFSYQAASISGNTVVCNLTTQMTAVAGAVVCELRVRNGAGTQIIGSCNFILQVEAAALTDDTIISETMIPLIEQAVEIASNLDRYITQTQSNAETAAAAATTATNAANSAQIVDANVTGLYNSIEEAKTNANTAAANANSVAAQVAQQAASGAFKGDKGDKGDSGVTTPVWGMYTMYVDESTGDLWLVTNGEYGSEYWFRYDDETGNLYYCTPEYVEKTVSGELIEITDAANLGALQCKVAFSPIQSGTGDPSPTNIRPISGRTGMTVTRAGKNLANFVDGYGVDNSGNVTPSAKRTATIDPIIINENIRYRYSASGSVACIYAVWNGDTLVRRVAGLSPGSLINTSGGDRFYVCAYTTEAVVTKDAYHPMVTVESADYATYEPFYGTTIPITWQTEAGTVYGGTLDVVSGVLTVDKVLSTFDGTGVTWEKYTPSSGNYCFRTTISDKAIGITPMYANSYKSLTEPAWGTSDYGVFSGHASLAQVYFRPPNASVAEVADWNTWLAANNLQVVYPLATPQTYQLTPTEVRTILGVNNVWSDGDTIEAFTYVSESYDEEG